MDLRKIAEERRQLEELILELKKEQERIAIRAIVASTRSKTQLKGQQAKETLTSSMEEVKTYASHTLVSHLSPIFKGHASDATKERLTLLAHPMVPSMVRG